MELQTVLKQISELIKEIQSGGQQQHTVDQPPVFFHLKDLGGSNLWGTRARAYVQGLHDLYSIVADKEVISRKAVETLLQTAILKAIKKDETTSFEQRLKSALDDLRRAMVEKPRNWQTEIRVVGLAKDGLPFKLGNIEFHFADDDYVRDILELISFITVDSGTTATPAQKESFKKALKDDLIENYSGRSYRPCYFSIDRHRCRAPQSIEECGAHWIP